MDEVKRQIANDLLKIQAVFLRPDEPFTWASGIKSPIYCDNRLTLTAPAVRNDVENAIADTVKREYPDAEVLMGTSTAGIATPPFKPDRSGFMDVNPGIASSYIFSLKPGDKVIMSGPYGEFHVKDHSANNVRLPQCDSPTQLPEMIWVGGGAGMAPLRAQIMHLTRTLNVRDREMHYFYGARALNEVFYLDDFRQLEKDFPNFHFHLALDRPDPAADAAGVPYTPGFVHNVMYDTYLKDHKAPEDIEYYMCGPGPMSAAVVNMLDNLGVAPENILYDDFGGGAPKK